MTRRQSHFGLTGGERYMIRRLRMNGRLDTRTAAMLADDGEDRPWSEWERRHRGMQPDRIMVESDKNGWPYLIDSAGKRIPAPSWVSNPAEWCRTVQVRLNTRGVSEFKADD